MEKFKVGDKIHISGVEEFDTEVNKIEDGGPIDQNVIWFYCPNEDKNYWLFEDDDMMEKI